jgi:glycogen phosphorylase
VLVHVWEARIGHLRLILLDTDVAENSEADRGITRQLYGGGRETRLEQEIVLGIAGVRALRCLGMRPTAWHINEGHAAFLVLERCREYVSQGHAMAHGTGNSRAGTVFTTPHAGPGRTRYFRQRHVRELLRRLCPRARHRDDRSAWPSAACRIRTAAST